MCLPPVVGPHSLGVDGFLYRVVAGTTQYIVHTNTQDQPRRCFTHQPDQRLLALVNQRPAATLPLPPALLLWYRGVGGGC